jgi:predicted PurR-regulated permease PerM
MKLRWRHADRQRQHHSEEPAAEQPVPRTPQVITIDTDQLQALSSVFSAPRWLRDLGIAAWLMVGAAVLLVGLVWLLALTAVIVIPVIVGLVCAAVATPIVSWLQRKGLPRAAGAILVLLGFIGLGIVILLLVVGGLVSQEAEIRTHLNAAVDEAQSWLRDAGVDASGASSAADNVSSGVSKTIPTYVEGLANAVRGITSLIFFVVFSVFSLLFLLKDGPSMRGWVDSHLGVPRDVARTITGDIIASLRRYFAGVSIVAAFNAVVVGIGALVLDVPLAGTIAVVTFVTAYIPFIGAFISGAFAVLLALGSEGTSTALVMLVIVILANGMLQNIVQPIAFGATLGLNPLIVLIATIGAGSLFGMVGLILGAPLTSAAVHIARDLSAARAAAAGDQEARGMDDHEPPPAAAAPNAVPG